MMEMMMLTMVPGVPGEVEKLLHVDLNALSRPITQLGHLGQLHVVGW